jgi:transcriptional regulator
MEKIILADNQAITQAGLMYIGREWSDVEWKQTADKTSLIEALQSEPQSVVVLDYTLFDLNDVDELLILAQRFPQVQWLLFSDDLSADFLKRLLGSSHRFGVLLKDASLTEIREAIRCLLVHERYIGRRIAELLLSPISPVEFVPLTKTEVEILKDIALGMTTKEISEKRFSSFHTVNTHRKNIFRKLTVNNVHEATKYALRAGLVDSAEYYI